MAIDMFPCFLLPWLRCIVCAHIALYCPILCFMTLKQTCVAENKNLEIVSATIYDN